MTPKEKSARAGTRTDSDTASPKQHSINKIDRVRNALARPDGLTRFDAERIGDHTLNSTVARLRARGEDVYSEWQIVPTRYCADGVRVKRYWIVGGLNHG